MNIKGTDWSKFLDRLPQVRGRYSLNKDLSKLTWFQVGGPAQIVFKPADLEDLRFFLQQKPKDIPLFTLGVGSNLLVRDGGISGVVLRLGKGFTNIAVNGQSLDAGAGMLDRNVSTIACEEGLEGLEYLCGIPGTIGGALRMNAGCHGTEMKDIIETAFALDEKGKFHHLTSEDMGFQYRYCSIPKSWIFVGARLKVKSGSTSIIKEKMLSLLKERELTQPINTRTGGSTFANPEGYKAWQLIDQAGCRGLKYGGAQVSELHCNFLINTGEATAQDLENLAEKVRTKVLKKSGISLKWEIHCVGKSENMHKHKEAA